MINRLITLYKLQLIDDQLDELEELRGDLPLAVNELTSKINAITEQINAKKLEKDEAIEKRNFNDSEIARLKANLKKFKSQLTQVRNNKEYDALTKEIDHTEETIDKLTNENIALEDLVEKLKVEINELEPRIAELQKEFSEKEAELKKIIKSNENEESKLVAEREKIISQVKKNDYNQYMRIRKGLGGKAIASVNRSACSGCHNIVPPQRQIEIRQNKKLYNCESCGRLLVSAEVEQAARK